MSTEQHNNLGQTQESTQPELHPRITDCLCKLAACVRSMNLYGRFHPVIAEMVDSTYQGLSDLLALQPTLTLAVLDKYLTLDGFPMVDVPESLTSFAEILNSRKVGELRLTAGITEKEIADFAEALCISPADLAIRGGISEELKKHNITHVEVKSGGIPSETREGKDPADIYEEALILIEEALQRVQSGLHIPLLEIRAVVEDSLSSITSDEGTLMALAGIRGYDKYLSEHSVNVCILSMVFAKSLGIDPGTAVELGISAMLHDVGKVFIPEEVIKKPDKLSEEEWQHIMRHPSEGARALAAMQGLPALSPTIALEHHAYTDGTGYPALGPNHRPHILSRLVAIVDTYDALTTDRPYRGRWSGRKAISWMLYEAPNRFDRQLMARFASRSGIYPIGSLIQLMNDQLAVIIGGTLKNPTQPTIKIISGSDSGKPGDIIELVENTDPGLEIKALAQPVEALLPYTDMLIAA